MNQLSLGKVLVPQISSGAEMSAFILGWSLWLDFALFIYI